MTITVFATMRVFQDDPNAAVRAELEDAVAQVQAIVNQPVAAYPKPADAQVGFYSPGWFHPGALKPDFLHVDVRTTQDPQYDKFSFITSDVTPGRMFRGQDCEFNPMTKWAYTDRSLPKKKLTEAEMVEINRLYRIIGTCEQKLAATPQGVTIEGLPPTPPSGATSDALLPDWAPYAGGALALALALVLILRRRSA